MDSLRKPPFVTFIFKSVSYGCTTHSQGLFVILLKMLLIDTFYSAFRSWFECLGTRIYWAVESLFFLEGRGLS